MPAQQATSPPRLNEAKAPPSNGHAAPAASEWPGLDVDLDRFRRDLGPMCERVAAWAAERADRVKAVYAEAVPVTVTFFLVTDEDMLDSDLIDEWFELDRTLVDDFPVGHVEFRFVRPRFLDSTINAKQARRVYGDA